MAEFAYRDIDRTVRVNPVEALGERGEVDHYYCPDKKCQAYLRVVSGAERRPDPFFRSIPSHKHREGCNYKAYYDEEAQKEKIQKNNKGLHHYDFSIDKLYEKLTTIFKETNPSNIQGRNVDVETEETRERLISSTKKLMRLCCFMAINEKLGESEIRDFLIDSRTVVDRYKYFIKDASSGDKIFLLVLPLSEMGYKNELRRVYLHLNVALLNRSISEYTFEIRFSDEKSYKDFRNDAFELKGTRSTVGILTKLEKPYDDNDYYYVSNIVTPLQLSVVQDYTLVKNGDN